MAQSIACNVCREAITSDEELLDHLSRHQSQLSANVSDWIQRGADEAGAGNTTKCSAYYKPLDPGRKRKGHRAKGEKLFKCSRSGCSSAFARRTDLQRHDLIHYQWKERCANCDKLQPTAGAFRQHRCLNQQPTKEQIGDRERLIEIRLGIHMGKHSTQAVSQEAGAAVQESYPNDAPNNAPNNAPDDAPNDASNNAPDDAPNDAPLESISMPFSLPAASSTPASVNGSSEAPLLWNHFIDYQLSQRAWIDSQNLWVGDMLNSGSVSTSQPPPGNAFPLVNPDA